MQTAGTIVMFNSFLHRIYGARLLAGRLAAPGLLALALVSCSVSGPPFRDAPPGTAPLPAVLADVGYYRFTPTVEFFTGGAQLGEVFFRKTRRQAREDRNDPSGESAYARSRVGAGPGDDGLFYMRVLGRDDKGAIRVRQYEGAAVRQGPRIELRAERCYLFGKRHWDDRLTPLKRWDCDHLVFVFESASDFARVDRLHPLPDHPRARFAEWFGATSLIPMPNDLTVNANIALDGANESNPAVFAGQIFPLPANEKLPEAADTIVWGYGAGRTLRDGQLLDVESRRADGTLVRGRVRVIARPGDFLLCKWPDQNAREILAAGGVAFTRNALLNRGGGLFE